MSRPDRWNKAAQKARTAVDDLKAALDELAGVQEEYQEWLDNLPENMQSGATADKLNEVINLDLASAADDLDSLIDEAENLDLPRGFGRD